MAPISLHLTAVNAMRDQCMLRPTNAKRWSSLPTEEGMPLHRCWRCYAIERKTMPWFYFDLAVDGQPQSQEAMILENLGGARDRADALAEELHVAKPGLIDTPCFVRVIEEANEEVYRTVLEPVPKYG